MLLSEGGKQGVQAQSAPSSIKYPARSDEQKQEQVSHQIFHDEAIQNGLKVARMESTPFDPQSNTRVPFMQSYPAKLAPAYENYQVTVSASAYSVSNEGLDALKLSNFFIPRRYGNFSLSEDAHLAQIRSDMVEPMSAFFSSVISMISKRYLSDDALIADACAYVAGTLKSEYKSGQRKDDMLGRTTSLLDEWLAKQVKAGAISKSQSESILAKFDSALKSGETKGELVRKLSIIVLSDYSGDEITKMLRNNENFNLKIVKNIRELTGFERIESMVYLDPTQPPQVIVQQLDALISLVQTLPVSPSAQKAADLTGVDAEVSRQAVLERMRQIKALFEGQVKNPDPITLPKIRDELSYFANSYSRDRWYVEDSNWARAHPNYLKDKGLRTSMQAGASLKFTDNSDLPNKDMAGNLLVQDALNKIGRGFVAVTPPGLQMGEKYWVSTDETRFDSANKQVDLYWHISLTSSEGLGGTDEAEFRKRIINAVSKVNSNDASLIKSIELKGENEYVVRLSKSYSYQSEQDVRDLGIFINVPSSLSSDAKSMRVFELVATPRKEKEPDWILEPEESGFYLRGRAGQGYNTKNSARSLTNKGVDFMPESRDVQPIANLGAAVGNKYMETNAHLISAFMFKNPEFMTIYGMVDNILEDLVKSNAKLYNSSINSLGATLGLPPDVLLNLNNMQGDFASGKSKIDRTFVIGKDQAGQDRTYRLFFTKNGVDVYDERKIRQSVGMLSYAQINQAFLDNVAGLMEAQYGMAQDQILQMGGQYFLNSFAAYWRKAWMARAYYNLSMLNADRSQIGREWKAADADLLINGARFAGLSESNTHLWNSLFWKAMDSVADALERNGFTLYSNPLVFVWKGFGRLEFGLTAGFAPNFSLSALQGAGITVSNALGLMGSMRWTIPLLKAEGIELSMRLRVQAGELFPLGVHEQSDNAEVQGAFAAFDAVLRQVRAQLMAGQEANVQMLSFAAANLAKVFDKLGRSDASAHSTMAVHYATIKDLYDMEAEYSAISDIVNTDYTRGTRGPPIIASTYYQPPSGPQGGSQELPINVPFATGAIEVFWDAQVLEGLTFSGLLSGRPPPRMFITAIGLARPDDEMKTSEYVQRVQNGLPMLNTLTPTFDAQAALTYAFFDPLFHRRVLLGGSTDLNLNHLFMRSLSGSVEYRPNFFGPVFTNSIQFSYGISGPMAERFSTFDVHVTQDLPTLLNTVLRAGYTRMTLPYGNLDAQGNPVRDYSAGLYHYYLQAVCDFDFVKSRKKEEAAPTDYWSRQQYPQAELNPRTSAPEYVPPRSADPNYKPPAPPPELKTGRQRKDGTKAKAGNSSGASSGSNAQPPPVREQKGGEIQPEEKETARQKKSAKTEAKKEKEPGKEKKAEKKQEPVPKQKQENKGQNKGKTSEENGGESSSSSKPPTPPAPQAFPSDSSKTIQMPADSASKAPAGPVKLPPGTVLRKKRSA